MGRSEYLATSFRIAVQQFLRGEGAGRDVQPKDAFERGMLQGFAVAVNAFGIWKDGMQRIGASDLSIAEACQMAIDSIEPAQSSRESTDGK